jgi:hypothetical protein
VFDVFEVVVGAGRLRGGSLVHVLLELGLDHPVGRAALGYFALLRQDLAQLAAGRGIADPEGFARDCQLLLKGTLVSAAEGDPGAVEDGRRLARLLIRHYLASPGAPGR